MLRWCKSEVNRSFFRCLAACRMRSSACDTLSRSCARRVLCWLAFPLASALRSTGSATGCPALFVGFLAIMAESDFPGPFTIGYGSSPSQCGPDGHIATGQTWDLPVPAQGASTHARFFDPAEPPDTCDSASGCIAFRFRNSVSARDVKISWLNGWPVPSPTDASSTSLRTSTHGLGPMRIASPSSYRTFTDYSLPVSRRTSNHIRQPRRAYRTKCG